MTNTMTVHGHKDNVCWNPRISESRTVKSESVGMPSDVYAFGGVLAVLFGEQPLWAGLNPYQIMYRVTINGEKPDTAHFVPPVQRFEKLSSRPSISQVLKDVLMFKK